MSMEQTKKGPLERFLRGIEILGNKIPNPMLLFISLCIIVIAASAICSIFDVSAVNPVTGEVVKVVNLFSRDGFIQMLTKFVSNFTGTSAMGLTGLCRRRGLRRPAPSGRHDLVGHGAQSLRRHVRGLCLSLRGFCV